MEFSDNGSYASPNYFYDFNLSLYNDLPWTSAGQTRHERLMHFLEYQLGPQRAATGVLITMCCFFILIFVTGVVGNTVPCFIGSELTVNNLMKQRNYLVKLFIYALGDWI